MQNAFNFAFCILNSEFRISTFDFYLVPSKRFCGHAWRELGAFSTVIILASEFYLFSATHLVSSTKSATDNCSARLVKNGCSAP